MARAMARRIGNTCSDDDYNDTRGQGDAAAPSRPRGKARAREPGPVHAQGLPSCAARSDAVETSGGRMQRTGNGLLYAAARVRVRTGS